MVILTTNGLSGQLISPGRLSSAHSELEGVRNCTSCHTLRNRGASAEKCLECHTPLASRIRANRGLHASFSDQSCSQCHKEHGGLELDIVRFDTTTFDHDETGFSLVESHASTDCRGCHDSANVRAADVREFKGRYGALASTYLGLDQQCVSCHEPENPHRQQFAGRKCSDCHAETVWTEAVLFNHDGSRYPLSGKHQQVNCSSCHDSESIGGGPPVVKYRPVAFQTCLSCHVDEHTGAFGTTCTSCHSTVGWNNVNRNRVESTFDHNTTGFPLMGTHSRSACASCHQSPPTQTAALHITLQRGTETRTFPTPVAIDCTSCHVDRHANEFADVPGGLVCVNCHTEESWFPALFDLPRHNRDSRFALTGAHASVPCSSCHERSADVSTIVFRNVPQGCADCHATDDPHASQFGDRSCDTCHGTMSFAITAFDHDKTGYVLDEAHRKVPCQSCHGVVQEPDGRTFRRYRPINTACRTCHGDS